MPSEFLPQIWVTSWTNRDVLKWSISHQCPNVTSCQDFSEKTLRLCRRLFYCYLVRGVGRQVLSPKTPGKIGEKRQVEPSYQLKNSWDFSKQIVVLLNFFGPRKKMDHPPFIPQEVKVHEGIFDASAGASSAASEPSAIDLWKVLPTETRKQFRVEEDLFGSGSTISQFPWKYSNPKDWSTKNWHQICLFETQTHGNINLRSQKAGRKNFGAKVLKIKSFQVCLFNCSCSRNITIYCPPKKKHV